MHSYNIDIQYIILQMLEMLGISYKTLSHTRMYIKFYRKKITFLTFGS